MANTDFESALKAFLKGAQRKINDGYKDNVLIPKLSIMRGKKYIRVVSGIEGQRNTGSAWAFIEIETGNVLRPDGWKRPAKHARGNIYDGDNGLKTVTAYGPAYLR